MKTKNDRGIRLSGPSAAVRGRWPWLAPGLLCLLVAVSFLCRKALLLGLALAYNRALKLWMAATGRILLEMPAEGAAEGHLTLFLVVTGLFALLLLWWMGRSFAGLTALLLAAAAVALGLLMPGRPWSAGLLLAALLLLALNRPEQGNGKWKLAGLKALSCLLCVGLMAAVLPQTDLTGLRQQAADKWHALRYEAGGAVLPEGDLNRSLTDKSGTLLEVTMEQPEALYLRAFVGETFDGARWTALDKAELARQSDLLYWLHADSFYPQSQLAAAATAAGASLKENRVTVTNVAACEQYAYAPYNLDRVLEGADLSARSLETGTVYSHEGGTARFTTLYDPAEEVTRLVQRLEEAGDPAFLSAEGSWRTVVLDYALRVSDQSLGQQKEILDSLAAPYGGKAALTLEQAAACALRYLNRQLGEDIWHTVSATVLALRYYGIPARYAEGFVIPQAMAQSAVGQTLPVTAQQATAWAEVYQDGLGWLPLELAPGYRVLSGLVEESGQLNSGSAWTDTDDIPQGEELEEPKEQDDTQQGEAPQNTPQTRLPENWLLPVLLGLLGLVLLLLAVIWLRHWRVLSRRKERFAHPDTATGLAWLFRDAADMLEHLGITREGGSMEVVCDRACERLGEEYARDCRAAALLNREALFSSRPLKEEQRTAVSAFREKTLTLLRKNKPWYRRLWLKWIRCVY